MSSRRCCWPCSMPTARARTFPTGASATPGPGAERSDPPDDLCVADVYELSRCRAGPQCDGYAESGRRARDGRRGDSSGRGGRAERSGRSVRFCRRRVAARRTGRFRRVTCEAGGPLRDRCRGNRGCRAPFRRRCARRRTRRRFGRDLLGPQRTERGPRGRAHRPGRSTRRSVSRT